MLKVKGIAVPGLGRGQQLGFPTANLKLDNPDNQPPEGVYAGLAQLESESTKLPAAIHVGPRPTFEDATATVEVHLIDFPYRELYQEKITLEITERLRDIVKFDSKEDLIVAIEDDVAKARHILSA